MQISVIYDLLSCDAENVKLIYRPEHYS